MTTDRGVKGADEVAATLEQAYYELITESRLARVGLKERQETAPIVERYRYLYTPEQIAATRREMEAASGERREELTRLYFALLEGYVEARVAPLNDELVSALATARAEVDGQSYAFHALIPTITLTADPDQRERLYTGLVGVVAERNPLIGRVMATTEAALAEQGFDHYIDFVAAMKRVDYAAFATVIQQTLDATRPLYEGHVAPWVGEMVGRPLDGLSPAHTYWLRRNQAPEELFPAAKMEQALRATLRGLGTDLDAQPNIHIDAENRPAKNPRACVMPARIPGEVHLIIKPTGGKSDYDAFFHEAGHAEHFAVTDPALPMAFRHLSLSMAQTELFSYLMENLVNDPEWLQAHLGLSPQQAAFVAYRAALSDLLLLRRYCAKYLYEYAFFAEGGDGPTLYAESLRRHTGFAYPRELWQYDRDAAFYSADYLRAWFGHAQVVTALRDQYGPRWWADPHAGAAVRELWRAGVRPDIEDVVRQMGGTPWDTTALLRYYERRLSA